MQARMKEQPLHNFRSVFEKLLKAHPREYVKRQEGDFIEIKRRDFKPKRRERFSFAWGGQSKK